MNKEAMTPETREEFLEVVYDGQPISLNKEEAITLAQKGMNYDRLLEKFNHLSKKSQEDQTYKDRIMQIAKHLGIAPEKVLESLEEEQKELSAREYARDKGIPPEYAKVIRALEEKLEVAEAEKNELAGVKRRQEELSQFEKAYPDVDYRELEPEVLKEWEESKKPLIDVYNAFVVQSLRRQKAAGKANDDNKKASTGSVAGVPDRQEMITEEMIKNMSDKEFNKNFKSILKQFN